MSDAYGNGDGLDHSSSNGPNDDWNSGRRLYDQGASPARTAAEDPSTGAGWKQGLKDVAGVAQRTLGTMQFGADGHLGTRPTLPNTQQSRPALPNTQLTRPPLGPQGPAGNPQGPTLQQRAQMLLQQGAISQDQYNNIMRSLGGPAPSTGMAEMASAPPTGAVTGAPQNQAQPYQPPAPALGPTSPAWTQ